MSILRFLFLFFFVVAEAVPVQAAAVQTASVQAGSVRVSDADDRAYRALRLDTGLEVLLVQDMRASKAAAALALPVGNLQNPDSQLGLAHYLEHMLFLGSEGWPEADAYQSFITRNGGQTNAATAYDSTVYMMEVDPPAYAEALRRMADTLARPRLDPLYADKERRAVHAEMESKKHSDHLRLSMLMLGTLNPAHPASRFSGGNLETLSDKPGSVLHEELIRFHRTWYSAGLMKAVLYGPQSLDELEALARKELVLIPDRGAILSGPDAPPVTDRERGLICHLRPVREMRTISLDFVLPKELDSPHLKPLDVVTSVLGTETGHSLVDMLRSRGLVLRLSASTDSTTLGNGAILSLFLELTPEGDRRRDEVLATVFAYLDLLRKEGISQAHFEQFKTILDMGFRFAPMRSGFDYVYQAAETMLHHPVQDVNYAPYRLDRFDPAAVNAVLAELTPANARIFHIGPDLPVDKEAFFFQTPYSARPLTSADTDLWARLGAGMRLSLPDLNPFLPHDFSLVKKTGAHNAPCKITDQPGLTVWHGLSSHCREPKAVLLARLQSAAFASTVEQGAMQGMLVELFDQTRAGLRYQALEAGLALTVSGDEGLEIRISGFSQRQGELLAQVMRFFDEPVRQKDFDQAKDEYLRRLANLEKQSLFGQTMRIMTGLLRTPSWELQSVQSAAQGVTLDAFTRYLAQVRRDLRCTLMGFGNVTVQEMQRMGQSLRPYLGPEAKGPLECRRILPRQALVADYRQTSVLEDSVLADIFLAPETRPQTSARILLLEGLLSSPFYSRLRTEEQLGYVATSFPVFFGHAAGIGFGVQSPVLGAAGLANRFASFYFHALEELRAINNDEFEAVRQGILASLTKVPDTLEEEFAKVETDLRLGNPRFDNQKRLVQAVRAVRLPEVVRTFETLVLGPAGTHALVQIQGTRHAGQGWAEQGVHVPDLTSFHQMMGVQKYRGL